MLTQTFFPSRSRQQGVGLIEVLVALLVMTIGILGMMGLQTRALKFSQSTLQASQALLLAYEMTDRIRANKGNAASYSVIYGEAVSASNNCQSASCTPAQIALYDLAEWKTNLAESLPMGDGQIVRDTTGARPFFTISVRYEDSRIDTALEGGTASATTKEISIRTEM